MKEIWIDIKNLPYQVSNLGRARSFNRYAHLSKLFDNGNGYLVLGTQLNYKKKNFYIHRLVAEYFIPNPHNLPEVNHKDGDKYNNRVTNLEWVTRKQNSDHAVLNNLNSKGEKLSVLSENQVREIRKEFNSNNRPSIMSLTRKYNVSEGCIRGVVHNLNWRWLK